MGSGFNGTAIANVQGGTSPFVYNWVSNFIPIANNNASIDSVTFGLCSVNVTDKNGCIATDSIIVEAINCCDVFIPNAFSPNGDNINDIFKPGSGAPNITLFEFRIYDRWGTMVYSTLDKYAGWDGKFKGLDISMDTYFYVYKYKCNYSGNTLFKKGDVILVR